MRKGPLQRLNSIERMRRFKVDEARLALMQVGREREAAASARDEGERKLDVLKSWNRNLTTRDGTLDVGRYVLLESQMLEAIDRQIELLESGERCEQRYSAELTRAAEAWRSHEAVTRKQRRRENEVRQGGESCALLEAAEAWLTRRSAHD